MIKKIISTLLCLSMLVMAVPVAFATGTQGSLVNVALNKTISIKQGASVDGDKENLVDGNIYTYGGALESNIDVLSSWISGNDGVGFVIDLGQTYSISEIKVYANPGNPSGRTQVWVDYSTDNATWTQIHARNNNVNDAFSNATEDVLTINDFGTVSAQYVRVYSWSYAVWEEIEVYAVSDDTSGDNSGDNTGNTPGTTTDVQSDITLGDTLDAIPDHLKKISVGKGIDYDVTGGKPCTYLKENLVDGDTANLCELHMAQGPDVLYPAYVVDLGQEYSISEIRLYAVNNRSEGRNQIWIDYSADGSNWYNVCATASDSEAAGFIDLSKNVLIINNFGEPNARYVRMKTYSYALMSELEVYVALPKLDDVTISGRTVTAEFSQNINPATVTENSFKVYADNQLLTLTTDYSVSVSGKNVVVTLNRDYYDTEFKVEATTAIKNMVGDALKELTTDTVMAPPAVEITGFEILPPDGSGNVVINASITNNTSTETASAVMFVYLLDANNIVLDSDFWSDDAINAGDNETPQLTISTSGISGSCKIKAFLWKDFSQMQVWAQAQKQNIN